MLRRAVKELGSRARVQLQLQQQRFLNVHEYQVLLQLGRHNPCPSVPYE